MKIDYRKEEMILNVKNVSLSYTEKKVLNGVNFQIHNITRPGIKQGQVLSIVGRSGSGKTSLFKLLAGYQNPSSGEILFGDGEKVSIGKMGVVPQDYPLFNHRTVYDNLALAIRGTRDAEKRNIINEYVEYFEMKEHLTKYPSELSGGQRQRISVLQQILAGNKFILLDEPFSGLDTLMKDKVIDLLLKVSTIDEHNTLIIVSHDIESSCAISDTVIVLANHDGEGSKVVKTYDFLAENLAYKKDIKEDSRFREIMKEIKSLM